MQWSHFLTEKGNFCFLWCFFTSVRSYHHISKVNCIWYGRWRPNFGCSGHTFWRQWITVVFDEVSIHHCIFTSAYALDFTNRWFEYLFWVPKVPISLKCGSLFPSLEVPKSFLNSAKDPFFRQKSLFLPFKAHIHKSQSCIPAIRIQCCLCEVQYIICFCILSDNCWLLLFKFLVDQFEYISMVRDPKISWVQLFYYTFAVW